MKKRFSRFLFIVTSISVLFSITSCMSPSYAAQKDLVSPSYESTTSVSFRRTDHLLSWTPIDAVSSATASEQSANVPTEKTLTGIVFYPGGRVNPEAYSPICRTLANEGYLTLLVPMPLDLAVFDVNAMDKVKALYPQIQTWIMIGHSLGGAMAASYAQNHSFVKGIVFLASYPGGGTDLSKANLKALQISAEFDGLATKAKVEAAAKVFPKETLYLLIKGGNHAGFGAYGPQKDDGIATISKTDQWKQTTDAILEFIQLIK